MLRQKAAQFLKKRQSSIEKTRNDNSVYSNYATIQKPRAPSQTNLQDLLNIIPNNVSGP